MYLQELGLSFTTAVELPTGCSEVELIPGGAQVDVTKESRCLAKVSRADDVDI